MKLHSSRSYAFSMSMFIAIQLFLPFFLDMV